MTQQDKFLLAKKLLLDFKEYVIWMHELAQGTHYDMTDGHKLICDTLQKYAEGRNEKRNLCINCPPGCLAGDSIIAINCHKNGGDITIKDLYEKFNGISGKWEQSDVYIRRAIDGKIRLSKMEACVYKGKQLTWEIELEDGKKLRATGGHKIMTKDGFKKVEDLQIGDLIATNDKHGRSINGKTVRLRDKDFTTGKLHPYARWHKSGQCHRISLHRAVYEANMNNMTLEEFRKRTYTNIDGMKFIPEGLHIHHIDGNHNNNSIENLEVLSCKEHLAKHSCGDNFNQNKVIYVKLKAINEGKLEDVYDIQCEEIEGQEPNYNANGILVHNTGKSLLIQYFITWCFARNKNNMFCYVAYGEKLIKKLSRESRNLMMMPEWEELFGKEMDPGDKSVLNYHLISGGVRSGLTAGTISSALLGVDAGIPGVKGFSGMLCLDDISSPELPNSPHEQYTTPEIYQRKLATRRRTPEVPTFSIQQRVHTKDFTGWILENEKDIWEFVIIPAINKDGTSFYPSRYPIDELRRLEKQNPYMFAAMYQQKPIENWGQYFQADWIKTFRSNPEKLQKVFITTDFGFTANGGDKSLFCCWGLADDGNLYLLRSRMGKWESPDAKKYCIEFFRLCNASYHQCRRVYIEQTLSGIGFIQDMKRECPAMAIVPLRRGAKKNKLNRAESAMTWMEAGRVYFRESDPNFVAARAELLSYNPTDRNPTDEWCFVAKTKIMTTSGEKNIEDIRIGDKLWTPIGITNVLGTSHKTKPVITNIGLTGTKDHNVWNPVQFRFDKLGDVCYFKPRLLARSIRWQTLKSYLTVKGISLTKRQDIIYSMTQITRSEMEKCFIGLFGNIIREKRYLKAMLFIILTMTGAITTTTTLCVYRLLSMLRFMVGEKNQEKGLLLRRFKTLFRRHENGTEVRKEEQHLHKIPKRPWKSSKKLENVLYAGKSSSTTLPQTQTTEKCATNAKTTGNTKRSDVVYAIKTGNGVYVANSVLVSNCDNIGDSCEIAFNTKVGSIFI